MSRLVGGAALESHQLQTGSLQRIQHVPDADVANRLMHHVCEYVV
jgi:hypothetical protein